MLVPLLLDLQSCASFIGELERLNDAIPALVGVGLAGTWPAVSLDVGALRARHAVAVLVQIRLIDAELANDARLDLISGGPGDTRSVAKYALSTVLRHVLRARADCDLCQRVRVPTFTERTSCHGPC